MPASLAQRGRPRRRTPPRVSVPRHRHPVQLVHDSVAGVLDIAVELVVDPGRYFLQEPENTPTDLLLGDLKNLTIKTLYLNDMADPAFIFF